MKENSTSKTKVLHITANTINEGASKGAYVLHKALLKKGIDSYMLVQNYKGDDPRIIPGLRSQFQKFHYAVITAFKQSLLFFYPKRNRYVFSSGFFGINLMKRVNLNEFDIIHFHWINNCFVNFKTLSKIKKSVVWTIRDMWPFTGGCHLTYDCEKFKDKCGKCPHLKSSMSFDLSRIIFNRKKKFLKRKKNLYIIAISNWHGRTAQSSSLFKDRKVGVINNCIDDEVFKPIDKITARNAMNLPDDKTIVLAGAYNYFNIANKGSGLLLETIDHLKEKDKYLFLIIGARSSEKLKKKNIAVRYLGTLGDDLSMSLAYSAADVFLSTSRIESFGKTIAEAMACGTPAVAFNSTGPTDIIIHKECGYLAEPYKAEDLARGIEWIAESKQKAADLSVKAVERVRNNFSLDVVGEKYVELYKTILKNNG